MVKKIEKNTNLIKYLSESSKSQIFDLDYFFCVFLDSLIDKFKLVSARLVSSDSKQSFYPTNLGDLNSVDERVFVIDDWGSLILSGFISNPEAIEDIAWALSLFFRDLDLNKRFDVLNDLQSSLRKVFRPEIGLAKVYQSLKEYAGIKSIYFLKKNISIEEDSFDYNLFFHAGDELISTSTKQSFLLSDIPVKFFFNNDSNYSDIFVSQIRGREWGQLIVILDQSWTVDLRRVFEIVAEQMANIFDQHKLHYESLSTAQREFLLNQISIKIRESLVIEQIIRSTVMEVAQVMGAESCGILLTDKKVSGSLGHIVWSVDDKYNSSMTQSLYAILGSEMQPVLEKPSISISNLDFDSDKEKVFPNDLGIRSYLCCGLFDAADKDLIGIIAVSFFDQHRSWSEDEKLLLDGVSKQLEVALMQASIYQESQQTKRQMALLHRLSSDIRDSLDLSIVLSQIARGIGEVLGLSRCFVRRFNFNDKNQAILKTAEEYCASGFQPSADIIFGFEKDWIAELAQSGIELKDFLILNIPSIQERFSQSNPNLFKIAELIKLKSYLSIPLVARGQVLGTINVHQCDRERVFLPEEIEFIFRVGSEAAIALEHAALFDRINRFNKIDPDTDLYNKKYFKELAFGEIAKCKEENKEVAFMMIDMDFLKEINDDPKFGGHEAGDEAIQIMAKVLAKTVRQTPVDEVHKRLADLVARFGGDEFMVFLPNTSVYDAVKVANRISDNLKKHIHSTWPHPLSCSIGVSGTPHESHDYEELKTKADKALYLSKSKGRNCISSSLDL